MTDQRGDAGPGIGGQIAEYGAELMRFREMLDLAFAGGARSSKSPEDRVVFPLLVSCRDIVEEILSARPQQRIRQGGLAERAYDVRVCRHRSLSQRLRYSPSGSLQNHFDECKQDFVRIWGFSPHI